MWGPNPIPSESRSWPDEEWKQTVDLRFDGIPNDAIYKDKQYVQHFSEQVEKLVNTERIFFKKEGSPRNSIMSEKGREENFMKQAIANCMKFSEGLTKYNVSVVIHMCKLDSKYVDAEES